MIDHVRKHLPAVLTGSPPSTASVAEVHSWLAAQAQLSTSLRAGDWKEQLRPVYPALADKALSLPVNLVLDLASLYRHGKAARFSLPAGWPADLPWGREYVAQLDAVAIHDRIRELAERARGHEAGLMIFLERAATALLRSPRLGALASCPYPAALIRQALEGEAVAVPSAEKKGLSYLRSFLDGWFRAESRVDLLDVLTRSETIVLTLSAAEVAAGAEGLDLPVLQACLEYHLDEVALMRKKLQRLPRARTQALERPSRSSESGIHGLTNKGPLTSLLRSMFARPYLEERLALHQGLFYQRHAPRVEPIRVLVAWVIDRGAAMQRRTATGLSCDSVARLLAGQLLEETVRLLAGIPDVSLRAAVLMHNGETRPHRGQLLTPSPLALEHAAWMSADQSWLVKVPGFVPYFFLREPVWDTSARSVLDPFQQQRAGAAERDIHEEAILGLVRRAPRDDPDWQRSPEAHLFHWCHLVQFGPAEDYDSRVEKTPALTRLCWRMAHQADIVQVGIGRDEIRWTQSERDPKQNPVVQWPRTTRQTSTTLAEARGELFGELLRRMP